MPIYLYKNKDTEEVREVLQKMDEKHVYFGEDGEEWERVWTVPNASIDSLSNCDPFDKRSHVEKTGNMKGTIGDLWNASREMSEKRAEKIGAEDPVKRKFFDKYQKQNKTKHFADRPEVIKMKGATIDFSKPFVEPKLD